MEEYITCKLCNGKGIRYDIDNGFTDCSYSKGPCTNYYGCYECKYLYRKVIHPTCVCCKGEGKIAWIDYLFLNPPLE